MKIVVSCDALVARTYAVSVVEAMLLLYENAELYTIVHHEGKILGPVEQRKIHSTYLTNILTDDLPFGDQWWKKAHLIPGACKNLTVPCNVDLLINISSGFSQGIAKCKEVKQITYLVENQFEMRDQKFLREKIFRGYLENWAEKSIKQADELWVPTETAKSFWDGLHPNVKILSPFIKSNDFPLFPEATRKAFPNDFFAIDAESLALEQADDLIQGLLTKPVKFKFVGRDEHLESLKEKFAPKAEFWGHRCAGELAPVLAAARGYVTFQKRGFAAQAFEAMSTGTPAWFPSDSTALNYVNGHGVFSGSDFLSECEDLYQAMTDVDIKKVHGTVAKFNEIKFKAEVNRRVQKMDTTKEICQEDC